MKPFAPPFCASPRCRLHYRSRSVPYTEFVSWGSFPTKAFGPVPRFRCLACGTTFSRQTFSPGYYAKRLLDFEDLARRLASCESLSAMARAHRCSTDTVSNRISRACRQALAFESVQASSRSPREQLAADGFESFCVSQYFPNNITLLVGSESQHVYAADHATLRRKGRMTEAQKLRRAALDRRFRPDPRGIQKSFARVAGESLRVLSDGARPDLVLWTDEHQAYPRAIAASACLAALCGQGRISHRTVSSRAARTRANPLFPVNYLDRQIRKDLHEHSRETVCFGRNVNRQMERMALYLWWHNYRMPHRARDDPRSHAEVAGYDPAAIVGGLKAIWASRAWLSLTALMESMRDTWLRARQTPLRAGADYLPGFARA
jgi:transposase-like protein